MDLGEATSYGMSMYGHTSYSDNLAQKKRRRFFIRLSVVLSTLVFLSGLAVYGLFYSGWMDITSISLNGLKTMAGDEILSMINSTIEENRLPILDTRYQKNTFFFDTQLTQENILAQFRVIKDVKIKKEYPHNISIEITERIPVGTWCFLRQDSGQVVEICSYFDVEGVLWGKALRSSGPLLLTVEDKRGDIDISDRIEPNLLESINKIIAGFDDMGIGIKKMEIPAGSLNDLMVHTAESYYVLADSSSNIDKQLDTLRIFLKNKDADFHPEYVDIRLEGRVYYK